jgi:branched-chain amino acid transport system ATP-binding protein
MSGRKDESSLLIEVSSLGVAYNSIRILENVSLVVMEREIVSLIGANGAGKTTMLKAISGMVHIDKGNIVYRGRRIVSLPPHKIVALGISQVPERRELFADLTVLENLEMGAYLQREKRTVKTSMDWCFNLFPILEERVEQLAGTLSGGEQQMLAIARGLMSNPKLLLLDEPSLGLAPRVVNEIFSIVERVNAEGVSVLLVEQNAYMALSVSRRGYVLENGRIALEGESTQLVDSDTVRDAYLGG